MTSLLTAQMRNPMFFVNSHNRNFSDALYTDQEVRCSIKQGKFSMSIMKSCMPVLTMADQQTAVPLRWGGSGSVCHVSSCVTPWSFKDRLHFEGSLLQRVSRNILRRAPLCSKNHFWHFACAVLQGQMDNVRDMLIFPMAINTWEEYFDKMVKLLILWNVHTN